MSFNLAISAASPLLNPVSSSHVSNSEATTGAAGQLASYDDGDWCPTKPPVPPRPHLEASINIHSQLDALMPQAATAGDSAGGQATMLDDDQCGTVPHKIPIPPPPSPWTERIGAGLNTLPSGGVQLGTQVGSEG